MFKLERNKKAGDIGRHFDKGAVITVAPAALLFFFLRLHAYESDGPIRCKMTISLIYVSKLLITVTTAI